MKEVAVSEAGARLPERLLEVEQGEQMTITRRVLPVAPLAAIESPKRAVPNQRQRVTAPIESLRGQRKGVVLDGDLRAPMVEGRDR